MYHKTVPVKYKTGTIKNAVHILYNYRPTLNSKL